MGVPVVARLGNTLSSRVAGAILSAIGMKDWVAESASEYLEIAVAQGSKLEELADLRRALPGRIAASAAGNPVDRCSWSRETKAASLRCVWQHPLCCSGLPDFPE